MYTLGAYTYSLARHFQFLKKKKPPNPGYERWGTPHFQSFIIVEFSFKGPSSKLSKIENFQ